MDLKNIRAITGNDVQNDNLQTTAKEITSLSSTEENFLTDAIEHPPASDFEQIISISEAPVSASDANPADHPPFIQFTSNRSDFAITGDALSVLNSPGQTNWEAIRLLKEELAKPNPDSMAMIDTLENLNPADRAETLKTLATASQGTSDYEEIIMVISKDPAAFKKVAPFLHDVSIQAADDPGLLKVLEQTFDAIDRLPMEAGGGSVLADYMGSMVGRDDILKKLDSNSLAKLSSNLLAPITENTIFNRTWGGDNSLTGAFFAMKVLKMWGDKVGLGSSIAQAVQEQGWKDIVSAVSKYGDWDQADPHFAEALHNFPDFAQKLLGELSEDQLTSTFGKLAEEKQDFSWTLTPLVQKGSDYPLSAVLRGIAKQGGTFADDIIRNTISQLGYNPAETLSKLSPLLLLDMQIILNNGDEQDLDLAAENIVNDAINLQR